MLTGAFGKVTYMHRDGEITVGGGWIDIGIRIGDNSIYQLQKHTPSSGYTLILKSASLNMFFYR